MNNHVTTQVSTQWTLSSALGESESKYNNDPRLLLLAAVASVLALTFMGLYVAKDLAYAEAKHALTKQAR